MIYEYAQLTDAGKVRKNNEDAVTVFPNTGVAVLADGMGGYNAGEVASAMAVTMVGTELSEWMARTHRAQRSVMQIHTMVDLCVDNANLAIYNAATSNPQFAGMGTTIVMGLFDAERVVLAHVGDSRCYLWRQGQLSQLTRDHSLLQEQIDVGLISVEQAKQATHKNLITRALGAASQVEVEMLEHQPQPHDVYLMCSDGLTDMLSEAELSALLSVPRSLDQTAQALVYAANAVGGRDNISVLLVQAKARSVFSGGLSQFLRV